VAGSDANLQEILVSHIEAWNRHDLEGLMALFAEDCVFESSGGPEVCGSRFEGHAAVKQAFADVFASMPDAYWGEGRHQVMSPGYAVSEWTLTGTFSDGRRLQVNGCDFLTVHDGKITKKNSYRKQRPPFMP
jgi:steroid delta-isomerase-like uncharacterized protein